MILIILSILMFYTGLIYGVEHDAWDWSSWLALVSMILSLPILFLGIIKL